MPDFGRWSANGGDPSLNEVNRTDRFLDALAHEQPVYSTDPGEAELAALMAGWRDGVRDAPLTTVFTPRDAVLTLDRATTSRRRTRASLAVVGSLAAAVLCLGGFGAVVAGAGPGDALYGLRTMLFGEQQNTRNDAVVLAAQTQMAEVQQLIDQGQWDAAQDKLETLTTTVATVDDSARKDELVSQWQELTVKVESQDAGATIPPGAPLPQLPDLPAVVSPQTDTSTATSSETTTSSTSTSETTTTTPPSETTTSPPPASGTSTTPLPTPSAPLPTPSAPLPTPSAPLPTPSAITPLPTPSAITPLPTPSAVTPLPTATRPAQVTTSAAQSDDDEVPSEAPPVVEAPAPRTVVTTTVAPADDDEPS